MNTKEYTIFEQEAFNKGAHFAMQETRLETALELITKVADEESSFTSLRQIESLLRLEIRRVKSDF